MSESSFEDLREILHFVSSQIKIKPAVFEKIISVKRSSKLFHLVKCLRQEQLSEAETVKAVYGTTVETGNYRALKLTLKNKLLNLVFMSDNDLAFKNTYYKILYRMNRNITAAGFMILKDMREQGVRLLEGAFKTALHLQETRATVACGKLLSENAAYHGWHKELAYYQKHTAAQEQLLVQESILHDLYHSVLVFASQKSGYTPPILKQIKVLFGKAQHIYHHHSSYYIMLHYSRIAVLYYQSRNEHLKIIGQCKLFSAYLKKFPQLYQDVRYGEFSLYEMDSYVRIRQFEEGRKSAFRCLEHFIPLSTPWMQFHEYYLLFAMRTGKMEEALRMHTSVTSTAKFKKLPPRQKERWRIHEAFLCFSLPDEGTKKMFNLFRFLNDVPLTNLDKHGYNFTIFIAKIILLINLSDHNRLLDIKVPFRDYLKRYIKRKNNPRNYYFGSMLNLLLKNNLHADDEKIKKLFARLKEHESTIQSLEETEIIPFEILWEMIRKKLAKHKPAVKKTVQRPLKMR